jgi:hypothetical protein
LMLDWHPAAARHRIIVAAAASFMLSAGVSVALQPARAGGVGPITAVCPGKDKSLPPSGHRADRHKVGRAPAPFYNRGAATHSGSG